MREFNVTGSCNDKIHYMVDISNKIEQIKKMVDKGKYFTINRARQYGKTTTLKYLYKSIKEKYVVLRTSFEGLDDTIFENPVNFNKNFILTIKQKLEFEKINQEIIDIWNKKENIDTIKQLGDKITELCECMDKSIVLIIDEVDKSCNHKLFLDFLGMLRAKYLESDEFPTFHSVILAGVHNIKTIRYSGSNQNSKNNNFDDNARKQDSPWNIAADFDIDMSFSKEEISTMLSEYEEDNNTGMDIDAVSSEIFQFTSGYPFLVSRICQKIDEKLDKNWTVNGIRQSVKIIIREQNTLFSDLTKNLENNLDLYEFIYEMLIVGKEKEFIIQNPLVEVGVTFGFLKESNRKIKISNVIFERLIYDYFLSKDETSRNNRQISRVIEEDVVVDGKFNMELCLTKFARHFSELFNENDSDFIEKHGRLLFLTYLKPLINGKGFFHIESETRDQRRMDVVVDYGTEQFIVELKIWYGDSSHEKAYEQLERYLKYKNADTGYMLTYDFRKKKDPKCQWESYKGKKIFDVIV
jgi:hypothetical protein